MSSVKAPLILAAVATALLAVPATAATPPARALFGGGAIGPSFLSGTTREVSWVSARVAKDGKTVDFYADVDLYCGGQNAGVYLTFATVPLKSDGSFSGSDPIEPETNSGLTGLMTFKGRFTAKGVAAGSLTITGTKTGTPCEKRRIPWQMRSPFLAPHHRAAKPGGAYYGTTKDTFPVLVRLNSTGRRLKLASFEYLYKCASDPTKEQYGNEVTPATRISKTGKFVGHDRFSHAYGPTPGLTGHWTSTVQGTVRGDRVAGTWKVDITITRDSDASVADTCSMGPIAWTAAR